jgi:hypothetical protein
MTESPFASPEVQRPESSAFKAPAARPKPPRKNSTLWSKALWTVSLIFVAWLWFSAITPFPFARYPYHLKTRTPCRSNLNAIAKALTLYHQAYNTLPPAYTTDTQGRKLHSWRTLILPYMNQDALYQQIDLSKPWDDPANLAISAKMPNTYQCPGLHKAPGVTTYHVALGKYYRADPRTRRPLERFSSRRKETLMVFEAAEENAVPWMSPRDSDFESIPTSMDRDFLTHLNGFHGITADGEVHYFNSEQDQPSFTIYNH